MHRLSVFLAIQAKHLLVEFRAARKNKKKLSKWARSWSHKLACATEIASGNARVERPHVGQHIRIPGVDGRGGATIFLRPVCLFWQTKRQESQMALQRMTWKRTRRPSPARSSVRSRRGSILVINGADTTQAEKGLLRSTTRRRSLVAGSGLAV